MSEPLIPNREQEALAEMAATRLAPGAARALTALFVGLVALWWTAEAFGGGVPWRKLGQSVSSVTAADGFFPANRALSLACAAIERGFDRESVAARRVRPSVQAALTGLLGAGNEQAYPGRDGWVYFRPDIDYLVGPGFLEPRELERRRAPPGSDGAISAPDPRPAILDLHRALADRGIALLLLPAPVKPAIHPEGLVGGRRHLPLRNRSELELLASLRRSGIAVLDVSAFLAERALAGEPQYLRGDSHWRPEAVEAVAKLAAERLRELVALPPPALALSRLPERVASRGDSVALLGLPGWSGLFEEEEVVVRRVVGVDGRILLPLRGSPVLLLGDSFSNVFSAEGLGWGKGGGLAEQLAFELGLPVDRIALDAGGARGAREALASELARGENRLASVRAVVWQFAARDLASGDWSPVELRLPPDAKSTAQEAGGGPVALRGTIRGLAALPRPGTAPYREALGAVELELDGGHRALVYVWALRDGEPAELAALRQGAMLAVRARAWSEVESELGTLQRIELPGEDWWSLPVYVAEVKNR